MLLKENKNIKLPTLNAGSFSGMDRLIIPLNMLILKDVKQREDTGNIEILCKAVDGPEEKKGFINDLIIKLFEFIFEYQYNQQ